MNWKLIVTKFDVRRLAIVSLLIRIIKQLNQNATNGVFKCGFAI